MTTMTRLLALTALTGAATWATASTAQSTLTLINATDLVAQVNTPTAFTFFAGSTSTTLSFAGYNVNDFTQLANISTQMNGSGPNLLTGVFTFVPAPDGSLAAQDGQNIVFGGTTVGSYDTFTTNFTSTIGASYTLSFLLSVLIPPNGLIISASEASLTAPAPIAAAAPEPATWGLMILGFGLAGAALRRHRHVTTRVSYAI